MKKIYSAIMFICMITINNRLIAQTKDTLLRPTDEQVINQINRLYNPVFDLKDKQDSLKFVKRINDTIYKTHFVDIFDESDNIKIMIPRTNFAEISTRYFSFLAGGQDVTAPAVSNFSIDLLDAKFDIKGAVGFLGNKLLLNASISGDKEGNIATLFENRKTGGKFEGELKISYSPGGKFFFKKEEKIKVWKQIREVDYAYYGKYLKARNDCPKKVAPEDSCENKILENIYLKTYEEYTYDALKAIVDSAKAERKKIFNAAVWSSIHTGWITAKAKLGGDKVYSITQTQNYQNDTIVTNSLLTAYAGIELNYYYNSTRGITVYANTGLGFERANNASELEKTSVTESLSLKDTTVKDPGAQRRDFSKKYDAFVGDVKVVDNIMGYFNLYALVGKQQIFGFHLGLEGRNNLKKGTDNIKNIALTTGLIVNIPKKDESKSMISVEVFYKMNRVTKSVTLDFENERQSQIGLTFNVPIPSRPKS